MISNPYELIDLSVSVDPEKWEPDPVKITVILHKEGGDRLGSALMYLKNKGYVYRIFQWIKWKTGFGMDHRDFPDGKGLSLMFYRLSTHTGTHMDAPFHYGDKTSRGEPARTITDIPLEWCYAHAFVIKVDPETQGPIQPEEIISALSRQNLSILPGDIALIMTGADKYQGTPAYFTKFRGLSRDSVALLVERGVKIIGIDSFSLDQPFSYMVTEYLKNRDQSVLWPAHMFGRENEYCQLERLANLDKLPLDKKFILSCFPVKLEKADASWCRVVALIDKKQE
ncbi:cyclase family protein [Paludibacterium paludis]|uniref:Cyclase n=1 Tax=Paludibacterium paludis TaxID=1225769 RepID=A0A918U8F9_9NEIS|nr:cyclase family protein [Paludibacterium paludis]GGY11342.1 cyclase [Paludibacterium paludis]